MLVSSHLITVTASKATRSTKLNIIKPYMTNTKATQLNVVEPYNTATTSTGSSAAEPYTTATRTTEAAQKLLREQESTLKVVPKPVADAVKEDEKEEEDAAAALKATGSTKLRIVKPYITATRNT